MCPDNHIVVSATGNLFIGISEGVGNMWHYHLYHHRDFRQAGTATRTLPHHLVALPAIDGCQCLPAPFQHKLYLPTVPNHQYLLCPAHL